MDADCRLVVYGTLAPGKPNHHQLDGMTGRWLPGSVRGSLVEQGWGAYLGFPAVVLDPAGPAFDVLVFESADLPREWARLDEFEGPGYRRVAVSVATAEGDLEGFVYALNPDG